VIINIKNIMMQKETIKSFFLHIGTGLICVAVHYSIMNFMILVGSNPLLASSVGFIFGAVMRFILAYYHVFTPKSTIPDALPKFIIALVFQGFLNLFLLNLFLFLGLKVWGSQIIATIVMTVLNFIVYKIWVFK
jgi:putative flippase GtrA